MRKFALSLMAVTMASVASAAGSQQVVLDVQNLTCPACHLTIEAALDKVPGVTARRIDVKAATVAVTFDPKRTNIAAVARAVTEAGFPAVARSKRD
jgi:mercuric ion binding protein